jgi:hypothetical protein
LRTSPPNFVPANLSSIRVCAFGIQPEIKKQSQIDRDQALGKDRELVADGSRTSPATMFRSTAGTRCLPSDLCKITAIETTVDRFTYLAAPQTHEYCMADLTVELAAFRATKDRAISPNFRRWYTARAGTHTIEDTSAGHSICVSGS